MKAFEPPPPSPRASRSEVLSQLKAVAQAVSAFPQARPGSAGALEIAAEPIAVLNEHRQVVFANQAFRELVGAGSVDDVCGGRPGEVLRCLNAKNGCGESPACRFCGAAQAIIETLATGTSLQRECHISSADKDRTAAHDFLVRTTLFSIEGASFVLIGLLDVSDQKRRQALERIFFHDILNTASSFKVHLELLKKQAPGAGSHLVARLESICDTLVEEIQGQKILLSAENGSLAVRRDLIDSSAVGALLVAQMEGHEVAQGRRIVIAPFSESFVFVSDDALVKRILENMLKNALEASPEGATVTLGFGQSNGTAWFDVHNPSCMEESVQRQVFRRFFSTKGRDRGLGTWGMKLLAEDYLGGRVSFRSTREQGTTFTLSLPLRPRGGEPPLQ